MILLRFTILFGVFLIFTLITLALYSRLSALLKGMASIYEKSYLEGMREVLANMFLFLEMKQILFFNLGCILASMVLTFLIGGDLILILLSGLFGFFLPRYIIKILKKRRLKRFNDQLADGLNLISSSLRAGYSLIQALEVLTREMEGPISEEFSLVLKENRIGLPLEEALERLVKRIKSEDLEIMVEGVMVTRQTGGNLSQILSQIAATIRERNRLKEKIKALTAQGRMSGIIIGILPIVLTLSLYLIDPYFILPMFQTPLGLFLVALAIAMETVGALLIKKVIKIDI